MVARPIDDLEPARRLAARAAQRWGLRAPQLVSQAMNAIFACDDVLLRVGHTTAPAEASLWLAGFMHDHGIRVPQPRRDEALTDGTLSVVALQRVDVVGPVDWSAVGSMIRSLHHIPIAEIGGRYPLPWCASFPWWQVTALLHECAPLIDVAAMTGLRSAVERWRGWARAVDAAPSVLCHGDVHPGNVVQGVDGPILLDWDLLCTGPAEWDHAPLATWDDRWAHPPHPQGKVYDRFADGYGSDLRQSWLGHALAELRLVAATLLRVRAGVRDETARAEAQRRLAYWRGEADPPLWRAM